MPALLAVFVLLLSCTANAPRPAPATNDQQPAPASDRVMRVHREALVIDAHADTIQAVMAGRDLARRNGEGHLDIPRMREGGLDAQFFAVFIDAIYRGTPAVERTRNIITATERMCAQHSQHLVMARSADEIEAAAREGRIAVLMGIEGGHAINNNLSLLTEFYERGVRYMGLTWSNTHDWADAAGDVERHGGLTEFGREVVREMNRLGMMVDISHVSDKTFHDVLEVASRPVIASHSSCRALTSHARNMTDDMLRALARQGGVCCINFYSLFVDEEYRRRQPSYPKPPLPGPADAGGDLDRLAQARFERFMQPSANPAPPLKALIDHIDHAVKVAGVDHVGLGSDFDGVDSLPAGMEDVAKLPAITRALMERGYTDEDIKKILGGNLLRVMRAQKP